MLGAQWGDEGKGKLVDILSPRYQICARVAGGSNAGHTIVVDVSNLNFCYTHMHVYVYIHIQALSYHNTQLQLFKF